VEDFNLEGRKLAEQFKDRLAVGQTVRFLRSHDKTLTLVGKIVKIHVGPDDCVDIKTIPDGKIIEVETLETAHAADVTPVLNNKKKRSQPTGDDDPETAA
jgi:hypothetical protein